MTDYPGWGAAGEQVPDELKGTHKTLLECLACFELWRTMGFPAEEIYFQVGGYLKKPRGWQVCLVLLKPDGRKFTFIAGVFDSDPDLIERTWVVLTEGMPRWKEKTLEAILYGSTVRKEFVSMLVALRRKGFEFQEPS